MTLTVARFNCAAPDASPPEMSARYRAFVEMAARADQAGLSLINLEEHHVAANGWSPSPLVMAGMLVGATGRIGINFGALLAPLYDPVKLAEDLAVLDLASQGRVSTVVALGVREIEYHALDRDWSARGKSLDHIIETLLLAWSGEPFDYRGETIVVTPQPMTKPHPVLMVGGFGPPAARRAARFGLPLYASANRPDVEALYVSECERLGHDPISIMPPDRAIHTFVVDDPDRAWALWGTHLLHEATTYDQFQMPGVTSAARSHAHSVEALRDEGVYEFVTVDQAVAAASHRQALVVHPLCGGMPIDVAHDQFELFCGPVMDQLKSSNVI